MKKFPNISLSKFVILKETVSEIIHLRSHIQPQPFLRDAFKLSQHIRTNKCHDERSGKTYMVGLKWLLQLAHQYSCFAGDHLIITSSEWMNKKNRKWIFIRKFYFRICYPYINSTWHITNSHHFTRKVIKCSSQSFSLVVLRDWTVTILSVNMCLAGFPIINFLCVRRKML